MTNYCRRQFLITSLAVTAALAAPASLLAAEPNKLKIGVIGSGRVGGSLGGAWLKAGHEVMFSSTHLEDDQKLAASLGDKAHAGTPSEAAAFADVLLISVPYSALSAVGKELGDKLKGKIVIDTCNPFAGRDGGSAADALQRGISVVEPELLPGARIVRAFNAVSSKNMGTGADNPGKLGIPIAGQDKAAVTTVSTLIQEIGFEPVVIGDWKMADYLHPGTPIAGEHSPDELRKLAETLGK